jgi:8-oxo-dGTP pyrophosphatase MutT (NUDIX family)
MYFSFMIVNTKAGATGAAQPRDAATVVVVRDGATGLEVLLLQRAERGDHNSGAWVFPGGLVDAGDRAFAGAEMADDYASVRLGMESGGLAFHVAAVRECFEESGILFALDADGEFGTLEGAGAPRIAQLRSQVQEGAVSIFDVCRESGLRLAPERLHYVGHWLTPLGRAKRFDTRFFLAIAPPRQSAMHDAQETLDHVWLAPAEALSPRNARRLMTPTRAMIELLLPFADTGALGAWAAQPRKVERVLPWLALGAHGVRPVLPHEPAFAEVMKLDPAGRGEAWCELRPNVPVQIAPHVLRVPFEGGVHTYQVGGAGAWMPLDRAGDAGEVDIGGARLRIVPAGGGLQYLVVEDRVAFAPSAQELAAELRAGADWLAAPTGFLQPLR